MSDFRCLPWRSPWVRFLGLLGLTSALCAQDCMRWVRSVDVGHPGPQSRHGLACDRNAGVPLLFSSDTLSSLRQFDGTNWTSVAVSGPRPADRLDAARMVFDSTLGQLVLFGGDAQATETFSNSGTVLGGVVSSPSRRVGSGIEWRRVGHAPPGEPGTEMLRLTEFAFAFDSRRGQVLLHGGRRTRHFTDDQDDPDSP